MQIFTNDHTFFLSNTIILSSKFTERLACVYKRVWRKIVFMLVKEKRRKISFSFDLFFRFSVVRTVKTVIFSNEELPRISFIVANLFLGSLKEILIIFLTDSYSKGFREGDFSLRTASMVMLHIVYLNYRNSRNAIRLLNLRIRYYS